MTEELKQKLRKMRKRIDNSSGCEYLYHHFDDLVKELEIWSDRSPLDDDIDVLVEIIEAFANECGFYSCGTFE